ncbi:MAG: TadE/TadG family type IV pilus assembly protein [Actinomycetota bacterium]|nr:TadE/TadG family type IV pilus assembly protein [Actinomycetota bacterium]
MKRFIKFLYCKKGSSAVEFAIILPILIMLILGIVQFGVAYNNYIALTHAAREGARLASVGLHEEDPAAFEQAVIDSAPSVEIANIDVDYPEGTEIGDPVRITVEGEIFFIDIPFAGRWGPIELKGEATMRKEK